MHRREPDDAARHRVEVGAVHVDVRLDDDERAALDRASDLDATDYPYGELGIDQRDRDLATG